MRIHVRTEDVQLLDPGAFTSFDVVAPGLDTGRVVEALGGQPCEEAQDLFVPIALVRELAGDVDAAWEAGFSAMLEFASSHGWIDEAGTHIKAHIVDDASATDS